MFPCNDRLLRRRVVRHRTPSGDPERARAAQERRLRFFFFDALCSLPAAAGSGRRGLGRHGRRGRRRAAPLARGVRARRPPRPRRSRPGPRRAARAAAAGSATARPRRSPTPWGCRSASGPANSSAEAASQNTRMMPCWSMGRIGTTATPTMTPSTPMKRVSSPTRIALSEMIASAKPSASAEVCQMSWPTSVAVRAERVGRRGVRLVGGVDEVVGPDVARDLGHRATQPEPDGADGGQDECELRHARPRARGSRGTGRP